MHPATLPRYFRATLFTVLAVAAIPVAFLAFAYIDYRSPSWDPEGDSGAVQGFMVIFLAAVLATTYTAVAFPAVARVLHRRQRLAIGPFLKALAIWLFAASLFAAIAASLMVGGLSLTLPLALILFSLASVLTLPFTPLWLWLAR